MLCYNIYTGIHLCVDKFTLAIQCHVPFTVPSAPPTQLEASKLNSSHIRLSWLPISSSHINAPVLLGYIVNYKETGSVTFLTNKTENTWIELNLPNNNIEYLFTVSGYNERGLGPNVSLAFFFSSLNASGTGNDSLVAQGNNVTNSSSGSSNTTLPGKLRGTCHTLVHALSY